MKLRKSLYVTSNSNVWPSVLRSVALSLSFVSRQKCSSLRLCHTPILPLAVPDYHNNVQCTAHIQ